MISELLAEARKYGRRRSIQALLAMAIVLGPLFHVSMQREISYQRGVNREALAITQTAFQQGRISGQQYADRVAAIVRDNDRLNIDALSLSLPGSLQTALQTFSTAGMLLVVLAVSLAFGSELSWGTYRNVLLLRSRSRTLVAPFGGFLILIILALSVSLAIAAVQGSFYSPGGNVDSSGDRWRGTAFALSGAFLTMTLWCIVGQTAAIATRAAGAAVAVASLFWASITFVSALLPISRAWNIDSSAAAMSLWGSKRLVHGLFLPGGVDASQLPSVGRAAAQLGTLCLVLLYFNRRQFLRLQIA